MLFFQVIQDKGGLVSKSYRFLLVNQQNNLEMSASDLRTRNEWITGKRSGIARINHISDTNYRKKLPYSSE